MIALEHYSDLHSPRECSKSLNNSSDTWEVLENAEKLLQEVKKKITESTHDVPWLDLTSNRNSSANLVESDSKIRQPVIPKLQEVNKQKLCEKQILSSRSKNFFSSESLRDKNKISGSKTEIRKVHQSPVKVVETCRKCSEEKIGNKLEEKYKLKAFKQVNDLKVKTKTSTKTINNSNSKINSKIQLPVRNVKQSGIIPNSCNKFSRKNVKTIRASILKYESLKQKKYDDILIDVAVQTSFKDQAIERSVSFLKDIKQNQSEKNPDQHEIQSLTPEILNIQKESGEKQEKCQMVMDNDHTTKTSNNDISNVNGESKGSFVKFLCQMNQEFENPVEILPNSLKHFNALQTSDISENKSWDDEFCDEWDAEEVNLDLPNLVNLDKMLCSLDKNIEKIIKNTDKLENLFIEARCYNKIDKTANKIKNKEIINEQPFVLDDRSIDLYGRVDFTDKSPKNRINLEKNHELSVNSEENKTSDEIKFILEPRSRISSYESVSSEVFHQQARFSTPLNNYRKVEVPYVNKKNADTNCNDHEKYFFSERTDNVDVNVDAKNDVNVFITRNRLSLISRREKSSKLTVEKIDYKKEKNCDLKSASVENFYEKSHHSDFSKNNDTKEYKISSSSVKYSSSSLQPTSNNISSNHTSININNQTNNEIVEISEKHDQEQSEKSLADDKMTKDDHLLNNSVKEKINTESTDDEKNSEINEIEQKNKLTPASSKNDAHNRTSFDISGIHSDNFEESIMDPESISKEHDTDKNKNLLSENEIEKINEDNIENITPTRSESEKMLFNQMKTTIIHCKTNEVNKSISSQLKIDKNPSTESLKNLLTDNSEKSFEKNHNDMKDKSSLSTSIFRPPSQKSISNSISNQKNSEINRKEWPSSESYSEGEIRLPDSSPYSIGEIRIPKSELEELKKNNKIVLREIFPHSSSSSYSPGEIRIPESMLKQLKIKNNIQTQSYGEILDTDVETTSSFESPGEVR